jgi:hypothetical protein
MSHVTRMTINRLSLGECALLKASVSMKVQISRTMLARSRFNQSKFTIEEIQGTFNLGQPLN